MNVDGLEMTENDRITMKVEVISSWVPLFPDPDWNSMVRRFVLLVASNLVSNQAVLMSETVKLACVDFVSFRRKVFIEWYKLTNNLGHKYAPISALTRWKCSFHKGRNSTDIRKWVCIDPCLKYGTNNGS